MKADLRLNLKPDHDVKSVQHILNVMRKLIEGSITEPGCAQFDITTEFAGSAGSSSTETNDPGKMTFQIIGQWVSVQAYVEHTAENYVKSAEAEFQNFGATVTQELQKPVRFDLLMQQYEQQAVAIDKNRASSDKLMSDAKTKSTFQA